jgi:hypothetical protein
MSNQFVVDPVMIHLFNESPQTAIVDESKALNHDETTITMSMETIDQNLKSRFRIRFETN